MKRSFWLKRGISVAAAMALLAATTVSAAGDRIVSSTGQYTINNPDGTTVLIDTDDIEANAQAIAGLQGQLGNLSFKYGTEAEVSENSSKDNSKGYYWSKDSSGKWVKIGAVGTAIASDVLTGKKFSSESGVDIEGTMPNPSTASVNTSYGSGNNDKIGATTVSINNSADTTESHDNVEQINLGINESITIPHGYYNKDIVINNGVANRGSNSLANYITPTNTAFPDGYYPTSKLNEIYNAGVLNGNVTGFKGATVTYHLVHQHVDKNGNVQSGDYVTSGSGGCYTREVATWVKSGYMDSWTEWTGNDSGSGHEEYIEHHEWHDTSHYEYKWYCTCGYAYHAEEPSTTDYDSILPTQLIKSVSVELF